MNKQKKTNKRKFWIIFASVALAVVLCVGGLAIYASFSYPATAGAVQAMKFGSTEGRYTVFEGSGDVGLVFYPGGKVDHEAYAPMLYRLTEEGVTVVLVEMPWDLAVLDKDAWQGAVEAAPHVKSWYIGGHSLGGAMASSVAEQEDLFKGLILLAAYPTEAVSCPSLSVYGTKDGVMKKERYDRNVDLLLNCYETEIKGGNHAGFGFYGPQKGDGTATISKEEQQIQTVDAILDFLYYAERE